MARSDASSDPVLATIKLALPPTSNLVDQATRILLKPMAVVGFPGVQTPPQIRRETISEHKKHLKVQKSTTTLEGFPVEVFLDSFFSDPFF